MRFKVPDGRDSHTTLSYGSPPTSGNVINGLGEPEKRKPSHVFHNDGQERLPWDLLDKCFAYVNPWGVVLRIFRNIWHLRHSVGPVQGERRPVDDISAMTAEIKDRARVLGADLVGVTEMKQSYVFEGRSVPYRNLISIGIEMDREKMSGVPDDRSALEVMSAYARVGKAVSRLSREIRGMGWPARAYGNPNSGDLLQIPAAIDAGLGQLGKHGSLISRQTGSNFRLGCVVTDLPLQPDHPADIGVDDLCSVCNICVRDCPVDAIFDEKQLVRGERKWYVDFDKCIYYFCETAGCGICIEVCPWSEEGKGPWLSQRLLARRQRKSRIASAKSTR